MVTIARSDSPWGPWENCPHNPILTHRSHHSPIQGLGHADLIEAHDGSWWLVCLGFRPHGYPPCYHLGRETFLAPVRWDSQGWPHVGTNGQLRSQMDGPNLTPVEWERDAERDDFEGSTLGLVWNFLGHPHAEDWSLTDRPGALRLLGNAARLDDGPPVIFVGRRQQHFDCQAAALLDFEPNNPGEEAGLTVWMNPRHHYDLLITQQEGQRWLMVRQRIGSLAAVVAREPVESGAVTLTVHANRQNYTFGFSMSQAESRSLATGETRYLSTEVAGGFTGVYFALYATGNGQTSQTPALFDWFDYRILKQQ
jgi:alpha-N-arabinofuranosidase